MKMEKNIILPVILLIACVLWASSKPMESFENYNVMIIHGAYPAYKGFLDKNDTIEVPIKFTLGTFFGDVLKPNGHLCGLVKGTVVCSGMVWRGGLTFIENDKIVVDLN